MTSVAFPCETVFLFPNYVIQWFPFHSSALSFHACVNAEILHDVDGQGERTVLCFCKHEKETRGGEPNICCGVYEMLTSQRWVDGKHCCPVGIKIYLSQVTPISNKQLDSSPCHSHTHTLCLKFTRIHNDTYLQQQTRTHTDKHCDISICQVWHVLQRLLSCVFNIPVSWSPSLISCCARACELTSCWITAFTYHTCQHGTQQPALLTHFFTFYLPLPLA